MTRFSSGPPALLEPSVKDGIWEDKRGRMIDRNYNPGQSKVLCRREVLLSDSTKRTPAGSQEQWSRERLIERPWLQLMCCAPVSGRELVAYFRVMEVIRIKVLRVN